MSNPLVVAPNFIYVLVSDHAAFVKIDRPSTDHGVKPAGHCLSKTVEQDGVEVVFQHWLDS